MSNVDPFDVAIVLDGRNDCRFPEDAVVSEPGDGGLHAHELGVLELDDEAGALAEVAPDGVAGDLGLRRALRLEDVRGGFEVQDEAVLVVYGLLSHAHGF